jgi:flagellar biogenesis protein FliO
MKNSLLAKIPRRTDRQWSAVLLALLLMLCVSGLTIHAQETERKPDAEITLPPSFSLKKTRRAKTRKAVINKQSSDSAKSAATESDDNSQITEAAASVAATEPVNSEAAKTIDAAEKEPLKFLEESTAKTSLPLANDPPGIASLLLRTAGALLLVVGLIVVASWGLRRLGRAYANSPSAEAIPLQVLKTLSLGDKQKLMVVRFGESTLLLGSSGQSLIVLATEYPDSPTGLAKPPRVSVAELLEIGSRQKTFEQELEVINQSGERIRL